MPVLEQSIIETLAARNLFLNKQSRKIGPGWSKSARQHTSRRPSKAAARRAGATATKPGDKSDDTDMSEVNKEAAEKPELSSGVAEKPEDTPKPRTTDSEAQRHCKGFSA